MDISNSQATVVAEKENTQPTVKKTVKPGAKKGNLPETRSRAKSTLVSNFEPKKNNPTSKKESKPVETIGNDRFTNLLSMFDKTKTDISGAREDPGISKKLDMNKVGMFSGQTGEGKTVQNEPTKGGMSDNIKKRMEDLMESGRSKSTTSSTIDPVLLKNRLNNPDDDDDNDNDDNINDDQNLSHDDDLRISEEEDDDKDSVDKKSDVSDLEKSVEKEEKEEKETEKLEG